MLHDMVPGTEELLSKKNIKGYIGFDPTSDSLGVGNMVQIMSLMHFQRAGHRPVALVGGATGQVGDPSGKSAERNLLSLDQLHHNLECQKKQLEKFLDFGGNNGAIMVNNLDWFSEMKLLDFIRDIGKHLTINYMMAKDSVQNRLETGMSFTEFTYQLIQGYDFYFLWKHHGVQLQMGGSDQWGNMLTGTELIRRKAGGEAFALTTPLIKKADGTKFGKTESGNVFLDASKTSAYKFYQFWINAADEDAGNFIRIFSLLGREEIEEIEKNHAEAPHLRILQKTIASEVTERVHGKKQLIKAQNASEILFGRATAEALSELSEQEIEEVFEGVPAFEISRDKLGEGLDPISLLAEETSVFSSKGEARRSLQENALSINKSKIDLESRMNTSNLLQHKYMLVQKGKKNYYLIKAI